MLEWGSGATKAQVECLTRHDEQVMELRLAKRRKTPNLPATVMLDEPSAIEYARLRKAALEADAEVNAKYPRPDDIPAELDGETEIDRAQRFVAYQKAMAEWLDDRHNYRTDEDHAPYAKIVVQAVNMLTDYEISLEDLTPECFRSTPLQGLLEVWETPLGGAVSPVERPTVEPPTIPESAATVTNDEPKPVEETPEAASPESTRSSLPGGEPSLPSPPPSSTP